MTSHELAAQVVQKLRERDLTIVTVESCTGGGVANAVTNIPGASEVLKCSFITYSNEAKVALGVSQTLIDEHTVYSEMIARGLAWAGMQRGLGAQVAVGVTGSLSRPDPANPNSRVGTVYLAVLLDLERDDEKYPVQVSKTIRFEEPDRVKAKEIVIQETLKLILGILER